ncbi:hypothetical protein BC830DRAFT_833114 [Chytriomyces sp. MP71]|nr:hypothetical protein BC830DRAFT_833114 [Chytriomyces sp. MP71]
MLTYETAHMIGDYMCWVAISLAAIQLVGLVLFISVLESWNKGIWIFDRRIWTLFNSLLLMAAFSVIGLNVAQILGDEKDRLTVWTQIFTACNEFCYLYYSWTRSKTIVKQVLPPIFETIMGYIVLGVPFFLCAQILLAGIPGIPPIACLLTDVGTGSSVVVFDAILTLSFIIFLRSNRSNSSTSSDPGLLVVAQQGLLACFACCLVLLAFLVCTVTFPSPLSSVALAATWALECLVPMPLIVMKIRIRFLVKGGDDQELAKAAAAAAVALDSIETNAGIASKSLTLKRGQI